MCWHRQLSWGGPRESTIERTTTAQLVVSKNQNPSWLDMAGFFHGSSGVVYPPQIFWLCAQTVEYLSTRFAVRVQWSCVLHCWFEPGHGLELWAFGWSWITLHFAEQMNLGRFKISQIDFYSCFLVCYRFESWGAHEGLVRGSWGYVSIFPPCQMTNRWEKLCITNSLQKRNHAVWSGVCTISDFLLLLTTLESSCYQEPSRFRNILFQINCRVLWCLLVEPIWIPCFSHKHRHSFNPIRVPVVQSVLQKDRDRHCGWLKCFLFGSSGSEGADAFMRLIAVAISPK